MIASPAGRYSKPNGLSAILDIKPLFEHLLKYLDEKEATSLRGVNRQAKVLFDLYRDVNLLNAATHPKIAGGADVVRSDQKLLPAV